ncbi:MAG TPA: hydrogenase nickel incorporation protein HypB [Terriglobales bacterium]|nr:hydrogenase nickel incorporation protein HypB [Terriglobales bacterium]
MTPVGETTAAPRLVEVRCNLLKDNDVRARGLRQRLRAAGVRCVSLVSSPGAGKTALLEALLARLGGERRVAALVGDLATDHDAARLARAGPQAFVRQINTGTLCHLEARMVEAGLEGCDLNQLNVLLIENVGNLVCPAAYDLGEDLRLVLASVTEGEDKPLKYPTIFNTADVAVITKLDLAEAAGCDLGLLRRNIEAVRPGMRVLEVSSKSGTGIAALLQLVAEG